MVGDKISLCTALFSIDRNGELTEDNQRQRGQPLTPSFLEFSTNIIIFVTKSNHQPSLSLFCGLGRMLDTTGLYQVFFCFVFLIKVWKIRIDLWLLCSVGSCQCVIGYSAPCTRTPRK